MRISSFLSLSGTTFLIISLVLLSNVTANFQENNNVILITTENSQKILEAYQFVLLAFYNSDDDSASSFVQDFEKSAKMIKKSYKNAALAYADCSVEEELCSQFRIEGTPNLKWYENTKTSRYKGGRTYDTITKWFIEKTGQPLNEGGRDDGIKEINDVLILTENNFDTAINKYKFVMVMFYADWHKQSQLLLPQFEKVAEKLKNDQTAFAIIDCASEKNIKNRFKLRTYPVLTWFTYGEDEPYTGTNQTYDKIFEWVQNQLTPITKEVNKEELEKMIGENEEVLMYFGENNKDFEIYERYSKTLENDHRGVAHSFDANLLTQYKLSKSNVVLFKKFGTSQVECNCEFKKSNLASFVEENTEAIKEANNVLELTEKTFQVAMKKYQHVLVKFYAPWCGHCKALAPEYEKASAKIKSIFPEKYVALAHVDATVETKLGSKFAVKGYPTLKFFSEGKEMDYDGGRTEDTIFQWINKKVGNSSTQFTNKEKLDEFISNNKVVVFFGSEDSEAFKQFDKFTRNYDDMLFAHVFDPTIKSSFNIQTENEIVLFKKFDEKRNDCNCEFTQDKIKEFVNKYKNPIVLDFDEAGSKVVFGKEAKQTMALFYNSESSQVKDIFKKAAEKLRGKILFLQTVMTDQNGKLASQAKVTADALPQVRMIKPIGSDKTEISISKYFILEKEITESNLEQFYDDVENQRIKPHYKSQDIPQINDGPVFTLVANQVDKIIFDESRDVFVKVYAPWCGHCKAMKQAWEELGTAMKEKNPKVLIAEYDATENSHDKIESQGFPTILYFKSGKKDKPISYSSGQRDLASLTKFVKENTAFPWEYTQKTDL